VAWRYGVRAITNRKESFMGLLDILQQYASGASGQSPDAAADHFNQVAHAASPEVLAQGVTAAMKSDQTPPFAQMVAQMFGQANPQQQAGMLNQLLASLGPGALAALAGGALGNLPPASGGTPQITPAQASQMTPDQVQQIAAHAEQHNPTVIDQMGTFYAQHSGLIKTLGGAALTIVLAKMANNMRA
jgi:hypothetical protein